MIDLSIERLAFISPRSERDEVDDYIIFRVTNIAKETFSLENIKAFSYTLTDATLNRPQKWADDLVTLPNLPQLHAASDGGIDKFLIETRGSLEPGQTRTVGVKTIRFGLVSESENGIVYNDPIRIDEFQGLNYRNISIRYSVIFPPKNEIQTYRISARDAANVAARSASWDISPTFPRQKRVHAELNEDDLPIAGEIDSCLCKLLLSKADAIVDPSCDSTVAIHEIIRILEEEERTWEHVNFNSAKDIIRQILTISPDDRHNQFELAYKAVYQLYRDCVQSKPRLKKIAFNEILATKKHISREAIALIQNHGIALPIPIRFADSLHHLLQFASSLRKSSYKWPKTTKESDFQRQLDVFLNDNAVEVSRESPIGPGRIDFLVISTPVELKATPLGSSPNVAAAKYQEQAAEYASRKGWCIGILLILDTQDRSSEKIHTPHLSDETDVSYVESRPGVGGCSKTIVVTITITAFPPKPSALKPPPGKLSRKTAPKSPP